MQHRQLPTNLGTNRAHRQQIDRRQPQAPDLGAEEAQRFAFEETWNQMASLYHSEAFADKSLAIEAMAHRDVPNAKDRLFRAISGDDMDLAHEALQTLSVIADEEDLYRLLFLSRRSEEDLSKLINGMLKKVTSQVGSLELQAKVCGETRTLNPALICISRRLDRLWLDRAIARNDPDAGLSLKIYR